MWNIQEKKKIILASDEEVDSSILNNAMRNRLCSIDIFGGNNNINFTIIRSLVITENEKYVIYNIDDTDFAKILSISKY